MPSTRFFATVLAAASIAFAFAQPADAAGRYFAPAQESASAAIAADPRGGLHTAFTGYDKPTGDSIYYRYCAGDCTTEGNWKGVELTVTRPINVQIATTPAGRPRLMITSFGDGTNGAARLYTYAACDADCLEAKNWTLTPIGNSGERTFTGLFDFKIPEHSFAVDDRGRPYFIFVDANYIAEPDHYGTFLMSCEADCTSAANWTEANIAVRIPEQYTTELWDQPVLAVAPGGKLRVLGRVYAIDEKGNQLEEGLYYYQCDQGCGDRKNWQRARVIDAGYGSYPNPTWDIEVLPDGRPRAAFFAGADMKQSDLDHELIYMWCDSGCDNEANWWGHAITATGDGEAPDLTMTPDGHPRLAFLGQYGDLGYLRCDTDCESDHGKWDLELQEATQDAQAERPTALPFTCDGALWNGMMPRLAVAGGKAWFAYDLVVNGRCLYKENESDPVTYAEFHELWRGARLSWEE